MRRACTGLSLGHVLRFIGGLQATLLILALGPATGVAQTITVRVGDETTTSVMPGGEIQIPVVVDMAQAAGLDIASLTFELTWDPSLLTYVSAAPGTFGSVVFNDADVASGRLATSLFNATGTTETFTAISIVLSADAASENQAASVAVDVTAAGDGTGTDILSSVSVEDLCLCIGFGGLLGDVSDDGTVNIIDAQQIARYSVGLPPPPDPDVVEARCDVNEDGQRNIIDAQQIARWTVGLPVPESPGIGEALPVNCPGCDCVGCENGITGTWVGAIDASGSSFPLTMWLTEADDGSVTGTALLVIIDLTITGSRTGTDVTLTMSAPGYQPAVFTGTWDEADALDGVVNGSGFVNDPAHLTRDRNGDGDRYTGTTSQGETITFVVSDDGSSVETGLQIGFSFTCTSCTGTSTVTLTTSLPITDGNFSLSSTNFSISGTAGSATTFSGTAEYTPTGAPPECGTCQTVNVTWEASLVVPGPQPRSAAVGVGDLASTLVRTTERASYEGYCVDMVIELPKRE